VGHTKRSIKALFREIVSAPEPDSSGSRQETIIEKIGELLGDSEVPAAAGRDPDLLELIRLISNGIERRNPWTLGHSERVSRYAAVMAQKLGSPESDRRELRIAAYLHDLGKLGLSSRLVNGNGKLSSTDWAILKRHPILSVELSAPLGLSSNLLSVIRHHHERFDGTGYPEGLGGSDIPYPAQILSMVNVYDSLTAKRPNWDPMTANEAQAEIRKCAGSYFDPDLARVFAVGLKEHRALYKQIQSGREPRKELL
jgi:putative nucleotidyltransferase with HDIG domain